MSNAISPWIPITSPVKNGEEVAEKVANRQPNQLVQRTQYLKDILDSIAAGSGLYIRDVALESATKVGHAVYWDVETLEYRRGLAGAVFDDSSAGFSILPSSFVVGIVVYKRTATAGDILLSGKLSDFDFINGAGVTGASPGDAGVFYLSSAVPGTYTKQKPPVSVYVGVLLGQGDGIFAPSPKSFLEEHIHFSVDLVAEPAGTLNCPSVDRPYTFAHVDSSLPGWLPADDASFMGLAPVGAKFGYNLAKDPSKLAQLWPPIPIKNIYLEKNGLGVDPSLYIVDNNGLWWLEDCYANGPFAIDPRPCELSSSPFSSGSSETSDTPSSSSGGICPSGPDLFMQGFLYHSPFHCKLRLFYTKMVLQSSNTTVTSLKAAPGSPIVVTGCDKTTPASTGDLCLDLNLALSIVDGEPGYLALKDIVGQSFKRGPMVEGVKAGDNIVITPIPGESETDGDGFNYGKMSIAAINPNSLLTEGISSLVALNGAREDQVNGIFFVTLPSVRASSLIGRIVLPSVGSVTSPLMQLVFWVLGRASGVTPPLHLKYKLISKPTGCSAIVLPSSDTSLTDLGSCTLGSSNSYVELLSDQFAVTDGDEVIFTVTRDGFPTDSYNADIGLLKIGYQLTPA